MCRSFLFRERTDCFLGKGQKRIGTTPEGGVKPKRNSMLQNIEGKNMYRNLNAYIERLEQEGELVRIKARVSPEWEIAELTDRQAKQPGGGKALLFENTGTDFPVATNLMGSERRIALALGVERLDELTERIEGLFAALTAPKASWSDKLRMLPLLEQMSRWLPRECSGRGACQQVIYRGEEADLGRLPILWCWPADGGRFVTLPLVGTLDPDTGIRNVGMYRMQVFGPRTTGMHWHLHKTGERHYRAYAARGERMPVAVCLGGDPAYTYAATAPMPDNLDEYLLAGFLRRRPVELVRCLTHDLRVPADCDFVIEGYVDPSEEKVIEGPFGDHTGFYSLEDRYPLFHVTAITHRRDAIYPATIVGVPPQEDFYLARATEKIFLAPIRAAMLPEVRDLWMPAEGVAHNLAVVNIRSSYPGQGIKTAHSLWGAGQMMFNKLMLVTASETSIRSLEALRQRVIRARWPEHFVLSRGPLDVLDHAAPRLGFGGKLALDLTEIDDHAPLDALCVPDSLFGSETSLRIDRTLAETWRTLLLNGSRDANPEDVLGWLREQGVRGIRFVVWLDEAVDTTRLSDVLWLLTSNVDSSRDLFVRDEMLLLDARTKAGGVNGFARPWPNVVTSSPETMRQVDERWAEYGLGEFLTSPSVDYWKLLSGSGAEYEVE